MWGVFGLTVDILRIVPIYLAVMNIIGLAVMGIDKWKAKRHAWRISEKMLFLVSILGGSIGTFVGMYLFRHKTKHWYFVIGMPAILILQIALAAVVFLQKYNLEFFK